MTVFFYFLVALAFIQIAYYLFFSTFLFHSKKELTETTELPVSIIICVKNDAKNLQKFLPSILEQHYKNFEIVLINDVSTDETLQLMEEFKAHNKNITIVNIDNTEAFWGNKKYALTLGIKAAKNEYLLFADADSTPVSKHWISEFSDSFSSGKSIVLGYGKYQKNNSLINLMARFETLLSAIQSFSYTKTGDPYRAVGRNLAYTKSEFFKVKGFIKHIKIKYGVDDLFLQDAANKKNTTINTSEKSFTTSIAPKTFKEWFQQKRRHVSTAKHYKLKHKYFLRFFLISKFLLILLSVLAFFFFPWKTILPIVLSYYFVQFLIVGLSARKLKEPQIIFFLPFLDIGLLLFQFSIFISNLISKPNHWK